MGCDVSKGYGDFIVLGKRKQIVVPSFQVDDSHEGHNSLTKFFSNFFQSHPDSTLKVGLESTGGYEDNWYSLLLRLSEVYPLMIARLNALSVKKHREASMERTVTDSIAAEAIASYQISYSEKVTYNEDETFKDLRKQWNIIQLLVKQQTQWKNILEGLLYKSHPELIQYCKDGYPQWVLDVVSKYPTAKRLAKAHPAKVAKIPYVTVSKAKFIIDNAKKSIASQISETDEFLMTDAVFQLKRLETSINNQKKHMEQKCDLADIKLLTSVNGIGSYSAVGLLICIVSVARFPTVKHLASYFGLHPIYKQSGDGTWGYYMSKKGKKQPRVLLFNVVRSAMLCNPVIKKRYEECLKRGMSKMAAMGVCMHKTLRIVYGMLKSKTKFNPQIDENNQKRKNEKPKSKQKDTKRRFQSYDSSAPISRRQTKKRKEKIEEKEPQESIKLMNGVIPSSTNEYIKCIIENGNKKDPEKVGEIIMKAVNDYVKNNSKKG